jgi:decaprenylphospho-beta-D-ribofuranose 2-oxidase
MSAISAISAKGSVRLPAGLTSAAEVVTGWGMAVGGQAAVVRPTTEASRPRGRVVGCRQRLAHRACVGLAAATAMHRAAACRADKPKLVLDLTGLNQVLVWQPQSGLIRAQAGFTIADLWRHVVADGWWPPVVSGTMAPTLGGAVAMNIHGKNAYAVGPIGDHVRGLRILTVAGQILDITATIRSGAVPCRHQRRGGAGDHFAG